MESDYGLGKPSAPGADPLFTSIDARLEAMRAELHALRAEWPEWNLEGAASRPKTAPSRVKRPSSARKSGTASSSADLAVGAGLVGGSSEHALLHMTPFLTSKMRAARTAQRKPEFIRRAVALGATQSTWKHHSPNSPGQHQIGYRGLSSSTAFTSSPAYTIRKKIVLSRNVDPLVADDTPGPGAYDTAKY